MTSITRRQYHLSKDLLKDPYFNIGKRQISIKNIIRDIYCIRNKPACRHDDNRMELFIKFHVQFLFTNSQNQKKLQDPYSSIKQRKKNMYLIKQSDLSADLTIQLKGTVYQVSFVYLQMITTRTSSSTILCLYNSNFVYQEFEKKIVCLLCTCTNNNKVRFFPLQDLLSRKIVFTKD